LAEGGAEGEGGRAFPTVKGTKNANDGGWDFVGGVEGRGGGRGVRNFIKEKMAEKTLSL